MFIACCLSIFELLAKKIKISFSFFRASKKSFFFFFFFFYSSFSIHYPKLHHQPLTAVGFEPTPLRNGALSHRLRPLGQTVMALLRHTKNQNQKV